MVDVNMAEMDCFEFINSTQLIKDMPVILMSSNVKRGMMEQAVAQGVCFFFMKPISTKKLKNIWQHVYRHQKKANQKSENNKANNQVEVMDSTTCANKKMQDTKGKTIVNSAEEEDHSLVSEKTMDGQQKKRRRLQWTPDLEKKFKKAVRRLGQKARPKLIMEMMDIPNLTQKQIANHLQKYRVQKQEAPHVQPTTYSIVNQSKIMPRTPHPLNTSTLFHSGINMFDQFPDNGHHFNVLNSNEFAVNFNEPLQETYLPQPPALPSLVSPNPDDYVLTELNGWDDYLVSPENFNGETIENQIDSYYSSTQDNVPTSKNQNP
uniref:Two-component response regulator ARR12-like n=1 Tax=Nicotiana sylvestris TaxID=4096 RepID=A0A1U7W6G3_NICSY|nr:PREDICTED: two-component response regulator ARR12-like [Nicotiana sylvestris]